MRLHPCVPLLAVLPLWVHAQEADTGALRARALAANCAACHGTDGRPPAGSTMPALAGMPREEMLQRLAALRDGSAPATVMHQLARGFDAQQLAQIAGWFAGQRP